MKTQDLLKIVDHTLLSSTAKLDEIKNLCDEAIKYHTASVCIPPSYVSDVREYTAGKVKICTVVGFPNGYFTQKVKEFETDNALNNGADEIDMVINLGWVKDRRYKETEDEIKSLKGLCQDKVLKVIVETCLLNQEEKVDMCKIVSSAGANYIKTSTGFSKSGATVDDVELFKKHLDFSVKIKAAGGINSIADAEKLVSAGANRLGSSKIVKLVQETELQTCTFGE